jgi:site-specific DNA-cytosine methylase
MSALDHPTLLTRLIIAGELALQMRSDHGAAARQSELLDASSTALPAAAAPRPASRWRSASRPTSPSTTTRSRWRCTRRTIRRRGTCRTTIWKVDPLSVRGRPVGLLWASPDCKHFSKAKGGKPVEKSIRDLAWVVVRWARQVKPRVIILENVEEFQTWGPLADDGRPCPDRKGAPSAWVGELRGSATGRAWRELRACDYGAPTIRKRLFLIARRDGAPIVWPAPTHGAPDSEGVKAGR